MANGRDIVLKSLEQLKSTITDADHRMFCDTTLAEVWKQARATEEELGKRGELRYMKRIEPYLKTLEAYAGVLEVFCQGYPPMAFIWGPIKLMLQLARNYTNVMNSILGAFSDIAQVLPRVDRLQAAFGDQMDFQQAVGFVYSDILEFHRRVYKFFRCKAWHFCFAIHWGLFEHRFNSIILQLSRHCELLDRGAAAIHFQDMKEFRIKHELTVDAFEKRSHKEMVESVIHWLSAAEDAQEECLQRFADTRLGETCNWVLEDPQMAAWIEEEGGEPVLWMTAIPGAGKSFLCSLIVQNLLTRQDRTSLYYFCGRRSAQWGDTCATILRTFAIQMLRDNHDKIPLVHQAHFQKTFSRSSSAIKKLLCEFLPTTKPTRIIVDGIDECECETQKDVLKCLVEIQRSAGYNCKILVSSRDMPQIQRLLLPKSHLQLGRKTAKGLNIYILAKAKEVREKFPDISSELAKRVEERLHSKAEGMFLWVRLVSAMLTQQMSEGELEMALEQLPEGLDQAYGRILSRIKDLDEISRDRAYKILFWVCVPYRPVTVHEVVDGLALRFNQKVLDRKTRSRDFKRDIVDICAPLLEESNRGILDVVHSSAKEYLVHQQSGPFIDSALAHYNVALSCIINLTTCLDLATQNHDAEQDMLLETRVAKGNFGLQSYATEFWAEHTLTCLALIEESSVENERLFAALGVLLQASKHPFDLGHASYAHLRLQDDLKDGLVRLKSHPKIHNLILSWLRFKSDSRNALRNLDSADTQQEWKLHKDGTYLSLVDFRLSKITEKILRMKPSSLPLHIDQSDYTQFVQRFKFPCRFSECQDQFDDPKLRTVHETTHVPSYPCLQCDFVQTGFRTRGDLTKHTQKYHMDPDDFEVPPNLFSPEDHQSKSNPLLAHIIGKVPGQWSREGVRAIQHSFRQTLSIIETRLPLVNGSESSRNEKASLDTIRSKIELQEYNSLSDFTNDLESLAGVPNELRTSNSLCFKALEKSLSEHSMLANFDHHRGEAESVSSYTVDHKQDTGAVVANNQNGQTISDSSKSRLPERHTYWSVREEEEFPSLLRRCGRDYIQIADYLKTKTPTEIGLHLAELVQSGRLDLADVPDETVSLQAASVDPSLNCDGPLSKCLEIDQAEVGSTSNIPNFDNSLDSPRPYVPNMQASSTDARMYHVYDVAKDKAQVTPTTSHHPAARLKAKRKPQPRVLCPECNMELRDEYTAKRHMQRFHIATRTVWVCEDVSIDKHFLTKCNSCSTGKRFRSRHNAAKHLRREHFSLETSFGSLSRWMREVEEPNPSFKSLRPEDHTESLQAQKRRKITPGPKTLPPIRSDPGESNPNPLPRILFDPGNNKQGDFDSRKWADSSSDSNENMEEAPASPTPVTSSSNTFDILADVSFDNLLPRLSNEPQHVDNRAHPYRTDPTLIQPHQVSRLPHLDSFRKAACQDQVDALYKRLDSCEPDSVRYKEALEALVSLSRTLMSNLRDWRRSSTFEPYIRPIFD